jgi:hypothetical protein
MLMLMQNKLYCDTTDHGTGRLSFLVSDSVESVVIAFPVLEGQLVGGFWCCTCILVFIGNLQIIEG